MNRKASRSNFGACQGTRRVANEISGPRVGIIFLVGRSTLFVHSTSVSDASTYGDFMIEEKDHLQYWEDLRSTGAVPPSEYDEIPRGRCVFDKRTQKFTLLLDRCILQRKDLVARIVEHLQLPSPGWVLSDDSLYRCPHCLRGTQKFSDL